MVKGDIELPSGDIKAWLNRICKQRSGDEPLERYLSEVEMRLHLKTEDLEASLEEESARSLRHMPRSGQEIARIQTDVVTFNADVQRMMVQLEASAAAAERTVALIAQLDLAKTRMESACQTLKEATELADVFGKVDTVFASGNIASMAALLGTMQRGLTLIAGVPEFEGGAAKLEALRSRFYGVLEPELAAALSQKNGEKVQQLAGYLEDIGHRDALNKLYIEARIAGLQSTWSSVEVGSRDLAAWLSLFCEKLLSASQSEFAWAAAWLPDRAHSLVKLLLSTFFAQIDPAVRQRLATALNAGRPEESLQLLAVIQVNISHFVAGFQKQLLGMPQDAILSLLESIYAPFESQLQRYCQLEARVIGSALDGIGLPDPVQDPTESVIAGLTHAVGPAAACIRAAADRCLSCTSGLEVRGLAQAGDQALQGFIKRLLDITEAHAEQQRASAASAALADEASAFLPLLNVARSVNEAVLQIDMEFRSRFLSLSKALDARLARDQRDAPDLILLRLRRLQANEAKQVVEELAKAGDAGYRVFQKSAEAAARFSDAAHSLIYDMLMLKLRTELEAIPELPVWRESEPESRLALPTFSAYPQAYATAAGEYLMMLPQLLESLGPESGAWQADLDADWLDKVAEGAAQLFRRQLGRIPALSTHGSLQLAADLEYFCNVLAALGVPTPAALATWQIAAQWPDEDFQAAATAALEEGAVDAAALEEISQKRRLQIRNTAP